MKVEVIYTDEAVFEYPVNKLEFEASIGYSMQLDMPEEGNPQMEIPLDIIDRVIVLP